VLLPKGTTSRLMPDDADTLLLVVETPHPIRLCEHEQVGRHSRLSRPCYRCRTLPMLADAGRMEAADQARRRPHTSTFYRNNPMNVVGWKGDLFPFKLNVRDIRPIMSDRIYLARPLG
jgi:homogentisate 1,2-dioxygenase